MGDKKQEKKLSPKLTIIIKKISEIRIEIQNQFVSGEQESKVYGTKLYNDN